MTLTGCLPFLTSWMSFGGLPISIPIIMVSGTCDAGVCAVKRSFIWLSGQPGRGRRPPPHAGDRASSTRPEARPFNLANVGSQGLASLLITIVRIVRIVRIVQNTLQLNLSTVFAIISVAGNSYNEPYEPRMF